MVLIVQLVQGVDLLWYVKNFSLLTTLGGSRISQRRQPIIREKFPKNCMEMEKIGPASALPKCVYVDSPLTCVIKS